MNTTTQTESNQAPLLSGYNRNPQFEEELQNNPAQTVLLLMQGAIDKANLAKTCQANGAAIEKGFHLGRLTSIIDALRDRLTFHTEGSLAQELESLYQYCDECVQKAVFEENDDSLDVVIDVFSDLRDGWMEMMQQTGQLTTNS